MCILLVEDNDLVRELTRETLEMSGHEVLEAADATAAISIIEDSTKPLIALVSDWNLGPGPNGLVVGERMAQLHVGVPIIIVTGRPDVVPLSCLADDGWTLIRKPYSPSELLQHVHTRLNI